MFSCAVAYFEQISVFSDCRQFLEGLHFGGICLFRSALLCPAKLFRGYGDVCFVLVKSARVLCDPTDSAKMSLVWEVSFEEVSKKVDTARIYINPGAVFFFLI